MLTRKLFNRIGLALIFSLLLTGCNSASGKKSVSTVYKNPLPVEFGDPFILSASDGKYYMYGTGGTDKGFVAYSSENLADWTLVGQVYDGRSEEHTSELQ